MIAKSNERTKQPSGEKRRDQPDDIKDRIDEASDESFPASDPPAWGPLLARPPAAASDETETAPSEEGTEGVREKK